MIALCVALTAPALAQPITVDGNLTDLIARAQANQADPINEICAVGKSGFDFSHVYIYYDLQGDALYVGLDIMDVPPGIGLAGVGVPGDADGDNNPDTQNNPNSCLGPNFVEEVGIGPDEEYSFLIDTNNNGNPTEHGDVRVRYQGNTLQFLFGDSNTMTIPGATGAIKFGTHGAGGVNTGIPDADENVNTNDVELRIDHWSTLDPILPTCFAITPRGGSLVDGLPEDTTAAIAFDITTASMTLVKDVRNVTSNSAFADQVGAAAGDTVEFRIVITNTGNSTLNGFVASDVLPAGLTFVNGSVTGATATTNGSGPTNISFANIGGAGVTTIGPAVQRTITFRATVNTGTSGCLVDTASTSGSTPAQGTTCPSIPASATDTASVCLIDILCEKKVSLDNSTFTTSVTAARGQTVFFRVTITNPTASALTNVVLTDTLPAGYTNLQESEADCSTAGNTITCNIGTLAGNATRTINYRATVGATATGTLTNTATVTGSFGSTNVSHSCSAMVNVLIPCIDCVKEVSTDGGTTFHATVTALQGQVVTFRVRLINCGTGPTAAPFFQSSLTDTLPAGYNNVQIISPGTCTAAGNTVTCNNLGPVAPGAEVQVRYRATVIAAGGTLTNTATVTGTTGSAGNPGSTVTDTCSAMVTVLHPCIDCTKEVSTDNATFSSSVSLMAGGGHLFWRIRVTNCGEIALNGVALDDVFPAQLTNVTTSDARCTVVGNHVHCNLGTLSAGQSTTVLVESDVPADFSGVLTNTATVSGTPTGSTTALTHTCSATVNVQGQIPTLTEWGLIAMAGLLGAAMVLVRRLR
jgi:uncharacterized repeat protein (TIGR01451 family)